MVAPSTQSQAEKLTTQEKLLLSQAIYKLGAISWPAISKLLTSHPCCVNRPSELFSPEACEGIYMELMSGLEINVPAPDAMKPQAKTHLRLAQTYYLKRMEELQNTITQYENRFKELMGEITSLKSGEADESIRREIRNIIARKYGKKLLDTWFPEVEVVRQAVEDGPTTTEEKNQTKASQPDAEDQPQLDEVTEKQEEENDKEADEEDIETPMAEDEKDTEDIEPKPEKNIRTMKTPRQRRFSPAVSIRSDLSPAPGSDLSPPPSDHPAPAQHGTRSNKRKASVQPKGAPASKRSGRRSTVNPQPSEGVEPEPEPEVETHTEVEVGKEEDQSEEEEQEVHNTRGRRNTRRESTRNSSIKKSPVSTKATIKDNERSPTTSRRAPSVTSTNRSTPAPAVEERERRSSRRSLAASGTTKTRGMRDDVVSKSVREQSAAVESVKAETEAEEEDEDEEDNKPTRTSARRGRPAQEKEKEKEKEASTPAEKRGTRASARNARDQSETENTPRYTPSVADISGELETPPNSTRLKPTREQRSSQKLLYSLLDAIAQHRNGNVFQNPVKKSDASDYYQIIKRPMDLKTIRARIKDGLITGIEEFERDVLLIFANAMMYNNPDTPTYEMAKEMLKAAEDQIAHFKNLQHHVSR
ncbi:hypothetical protein L486_00863 [Kwoniella mangroviensis CBS 10435]|uniref:Bromo domain-containing protein n=1 Tax=Kwoniella mangroviensis CBS 10435 TaxID=1331196 RepID=A0A1B9J0B3_9TREE|nr:hypothetical protein L486_00863 [Kwoniella mangroviensis CBS 10435]